MRRPTFADVITKLGLAGYSPAVISCPLSPIGYKEAFLMLISKKSKEAHEEDELPRWSLVTIFTSFFAVGMIASILTASATLKAVFGSKDQQLSEFSSIALVAPQIWSGLLSPVYLLTFSAVFHRVHVRTRSVGRAGGLSMGGSFLVSLLLLCFVWWCSGNGPVQVVPSNAGQPVAGGVSTRTGEAAETGINHRLILVTNNERIWFRGAEIPIESLEAVVGEAGISGDALIVRMEGDAPLRLVLNVLKALGRHQFMGTLDAPGPGYRGKLEAVGR